MAFIPNSGALLQESQKQWRMTRYGQNILMITEQTAINHYYEDIKLQEPVKNWMCVSSHYKTELCRHYYEIGFCIYGDRCMFAHGVTDLITKLDRHPNYKTKICSAYHVSGYCSFGSRCSFIHKKRDPFDIIQSAIAARPKHPMPGKTGSDTLVSQLHSKVSLERLADQEMMSDCNLMPSQFIVSNYKRLPTFVKITNRC